MAYAYRADVETARDIHLQRLRRARPANDFTTMRGALHSLTIMSRVLGQIDEAVTHGAELLDESSSARRRATTRSCTLHAA